MIAGFEIISKLGQGGMGAVLKARQVSLDRIVALKVLIAQKDPVFIERFFREARVSAKLNHPNIVQGIEVGQDERSGLYYFAMEYIDGPTLRQMMKKEGVFEERRALEIIRCVASALASANKAGIVHRDIKPDNILITSRGEPKLADLGLAKRMSESETANVAADSSSPASGPGVDASLTQAGSAMGTPYYMAPEQVTGVGQMDIRTDLYALGATFFHLLAGQPPFNGKGSSEIMRARLTADAPDVRNAAPEVSEATAGVIRKLLQKEPAKRFQTPEELEQEIARILKGASATPAGATRERKKPAAGSRAGSGSGERRGTGKNEPAAKGSATAYLLAGGGVLLLGALAYFVGQGNSAAQPAVAKAEAIPEKPETLPVAAAEKVVPTPLPDQKSAVVNVPPKGEVKVASATESIAPATPPVNPIEKAAPATTPAPTTAPPPEVKSPEPKAKDDVPADPAAKIAETNANTPPPARPVPAPAPDGAAQLALDALLTEYAINMNVGLDKKAASLLADALSKPELASVAPAIKAEQTRLAWFAELDKAAVVGAAKLTDNRAFTLVLKDSNKKEEIGGKSKQKITRFKDGVLEGELNDQGATMGLRFKLANLSDATRRELSLLSVEGNKAASAEMEAKWLYRDVLACAVKPTPAKLSSIDARLIVLGDEGAPAELCDGLKQWQKRMYDKMESALKVAAKQAADEKQKLDEKRAAQNFYYKLNEGDWVAYKHTDGNTHAVKVTVMKKDDKSVTVVHDFPFTSADLRTERTISLAEPYSLHDMLNFSGDAKKTDEGEETVNINGKSYECKREFWWDAWKRNPKNKSEFVEVEHQIWYCPDAPGCGLVKYQMKWIKSHDPREHPYEGLYGCLCELSDSGSAGK